MSKINRSLSKCRLLDLCFPPTIAIHKKYKHKQRKLKRRQAINSSLNSPLVED